MGELINGRTPEKILFNIRVCAHGLCLSECPYDSSANCKEDLLSDALAYIKHLEAQQPKWISVKERLPEHRQHVYACAKDKFRFEGIYIDPVGFERYEIGEGWVNENRNVTHWMPLPEPPKGEDK